MRSHFVVCCPAVVTEYADQGDI